MILLVMHMMKTWDRKNKQKGQQTLINFLDTKHLNISWKWPSLYLFNKVTFVVLKLLKGMKHNRMVVLTREYLLFGGQPWQYAVSWSLKHCMYLVFSGECMLCSNYSFLDSIELITDLLESYKIKKWPKL